MPEDAIYRTWVTWNGNGFDLPWLGLRAAKYHIPRLGRCIPTDKWGKNSTDLAQVLKMTDYRGFIPAASKAGQFILETSAEDDEGSTGADVYQAWLDDRVDDTILHAVNDVRRLRAMHTRLAAVGMC